ncbi:unnamed protein product [Strongylus vulgaris]|uniref:Uncharacterized protein n=1 Tax=Strongylus vulgaris TaxID=40348 RepID=A0A3P7J4I4_STRVU|nr:unnamed protein product [Strongylus vulgaris]
MSPNAHFPPSFHEKDCMYDGIVNYLRRHTFPPFIKLTTNKQIARAEFRKKCESFYIDQRGVLIEGRAGGLHRHVLRRGELAHVMKFVHEVLGHCNAEVWCVYLILFLAVFCIAIQKILRNRIDIPFPSINFLYIPVNVGNNRHG